MLEEDLTQPFYIAIVIFTQLISLHATVILLCGTVIQRFRIGFRVVYNKYFVNRESR